MQGWASVLASVLFLGGVQLLCLGLLGEYLGRLYAAVQGRPAYFIAYDSIRGPDRQRRAELARQARPEPAVDWFGQPAGRS